jgi:hypothetical protein
MIYDDLSSNLTTKTNISILLIGKPVGSSKEGVKSTLDHIKNPSNIL